MSLPAPRELRADLAGHCALVTGASGTFGAHFARVLANAGARVVLAARRADLLAMLAVELRSTGATVASVALDVTSTSSVAAAFAAIPAEFGVPDIVINNAGTTHAALALEQTEADWDRVVDTNLKGAFLVAQEAARRLIAAGAQGSIINIASVMGLVPARLQSPFVAAKAGVVNLTRSMALELGPQGVLVNCIAPGSILTEVTKKLFYSGDGQFSERVQSLLAHIPLGRPGSCEEIAHAVLFLAAPESSYINGAVLTVDGGWLAGYTREF